MENEINVVWDENNIIVSVKDATNSVTVFNTNTHNGIKDTPENCKIALEALGIDVTPIDDYLDEG